MLHTHRVRTLDEVRSFLDGTEPVEVQSLNRGARYEFVAQTFRRCRYGQLGKAEKGVLRRFLVKVSGLSRAQLTRLIVRHRSTGRIDDRRGPPRGHFMLARTAWVTPRCALIRPAHLSVAGIPRHRAPRIVHWRPPAGPEARVETQHEMTLRPTAAALPPALHWRRHPPARACRAPPLQRSSGRHPPGWSRCRTPAPCQP